MIKQGTTADLVYEYFSSKEVWADFSSALATVYGVNVESPTRQLELIRFISQDTDMEILSKTARLLGFDLTQDVLDASGSSLQRLVSQLPQYPYQNSTEKFKNFVDIILNAVTEVTYLYTKDYVNFKPAPEGTLVIDGGIWFKTTHIRIDIALLNLNLVLRPGQTLVDRVKELFYEYAPIALVIERLNFVVVFNDQSFKQAAAFGIGVSMRVGNVTKRLD